MPSEFDSYAREYTELLRDPFRDRFATAPLFFHQRKWSVIREFFGSSCRSMREASWLDVGCGRGELLRLGQSEFGHVAGCDLSQEMLKASEGLEVRLQTTPVALPFDSGSFDFVTAVCVYHHVSLSDRDALTQDAFRVLSPGGILCVIEHNPLNPLTRRIVGRAQVDANANLLGHSEAKRLVGSAGFSCVDTEFFLYVPEPAFRRMPWLEALLKRVPMGGQYALFAEKSVASDVRRHA
jgi:SAM-dependent methyltransferase